MMQEVEGDIAPVSVSMPTASGPVGDPNQAQIDNILVLATTAYEAQNYAEAENYCNRAIEIDAMCFKAWDLKGKAVGWQSKVDNLRIEEAAHSFCKAIDFAPEEEKEELKTQAVEELKKLGLALILVRKQRFSVCPDSTELNGFTRDRKAMLDAILVLLSHGNAVGMPEGYLEQIAIMMNEAAVAATNMARTVWNEVDYPSDKDLQTYLDWMGNIESLLRQAIDASDADDEADIQRYKNLIIVLEDPINKSSYKRVWDSYASEYRWINSKCLTNSAISTRQRQVKECRDRIAELEKKVKEKKDAEAKKAEAERQARIKAYWEAHADEKRALEAELEELEDKCNNLQAEISELESQIKAETPTGNVPSENEDNKVMDRIRELENRRPNLGLFAGKERKRIGEELATLYGKHDTLKAKIEQEKTDRLAKIDAKLAPITYKRKKLDSELDKVYKRRVVILTKLKKDPS